MPRGGVVGEDVGCAGCGEVNSHPLDKHIFEGR